MDNKISFSAYSALFNNVDNCIFTRNKVSNQVKWINKDDNDLNIKIKNEKRLKRILFNEIKSLYNNRINRYNLEGFSRINDEKIKDLEINKFFLVEDKFKGTSGQYSVFPRTFYCDKCGDLRVFSNTDEWKHFDVKNCRNKNCNGKYKQFNYVTFCPHCGQIKNIYPKCETHGTKYLKLIKNTENQKYWKVKCTKCGEFIDLYYSFCNHKDIYNLNHSISNEKSSKVMLLPVMQNSIFRSVVKTIVDVQNLEWEDNVDSIMLGSYLGKFNYLFSSNDDVNNPERILEYITTVLKTFEPHKENPQKAIDLGIIGPNLPQIVSNIENTITEIKKNYFDEEFTELTDYLILKNYFGDNKGNKKFTEYIEIHDSFKREFEKLKNILKISEITYIPDIHLISSSIGTNRGVSTLEDNYLNHFEPHWKSKDKDIFKVYSYPFETEGIIFDLNKVEVVKWLIKNKFLNGDEFNQFMDEDEAKNIIMNLDKDGEAYSHLKILLHTFSHIMIRRSSLYTGLDVDSCGELLFPKSAAFLIYSTSNINIGGFSFVFENSMIDWFQDVQLDIKDCIFDPSCLDDNGACFSCLYLPEFVCGFFNGFLDRDVFLGKTDRYCVGFWSIDIN